MLQLLHKRCAWQSLAPVSSVSQIFGAYYILVTFSFLCVWVHSVQRFSVGSNTHVATIYSCADADSIEKHISATPETLIFNKAAGCMWLRVLISDISKYAQTHTTVYCILSNYNGIL